MKRFLVLNGPNLNLLGTRDPEVYGKERLEEINQWLVEQAKEHKVEIAFFQSNHEGELIDQLHQANLTVDGVVFNPGGYSHTSVALRDAVEAISIPVIEVHLSNIHGRDSFRHTSMIAPECIGQIAGFGKHSYLLGILSLLFGTAG